MAMPSSKILLWSPRILGVLVCLFLSLFALDAFESGKSLGQALPDYAVHIAPMLVLLAIVAISWRYEWVGGIVFTGLATAYAIFARGHLSWIAAIGAPLLVVGLLFLWSWRHHEELRATA
jgi:glucose-6-phosphate-specific signal transduction histidine kinase